MGLFSVGILYWLLICVSIVSFIWGVWKKSWKSFLVSGLALFIPTLSLYVGGTEDWFVWSAFAPIAILILSYTFKKKY